MAGQAAGTVHAAGLDGLAPDLRHDVAFAAQVLVAEGQEVVDDKGFVAVPDGVEVDIVVVLVEEQETQPRLESVDGDDEEDADNPSLLGRVGVVPQVLVNLVARNEYGCPNTGSGNAFARSVFQK